MSGLLGQHRDNQAVIEYLVEQAKDIDWVVHQAGIFSDGPSKGVLVRSADRVSMASFVDTATYNYNALNDPSAVHRSEEHTSELQSLMSISYAVLCFNQKNNIHLL